MQPGGITTSISPALKRKAVAEATKKERYASLLRDCPELTHEVPRVKRAKDFDKARMKPTLKKPSGKRTGQGPLTTTQGIQAFGLGSDVAAEQDEGDTDADNEDESEDIKPPGGIMRSSSVGCFECVRGESNALPPRVLLPSPLSSQRRNRRETSDPVCGTSLPKLGPMSNSR